MILLRWIVDECIATSIVTHLRESGPDVAYVNEDSPGISDLDVIRRAHFEDRVVLTEDRDFGDLIFRQSLTVPGAVLLRFSVDDRQKALPRLIAVIEALGDALRGHQTVIEVSKYRSRRLPDF